MFPQKISRLLFVSITKCCKLLKFILLLLGLGALLISQLVDWRSHIMEKTSITKAFKVHSRNGVHVHVTMLSRVCLSHKHVISSEPARVRVCVGEV